MRCLYLANGLPISPSFRGGGGAVYYEQLASLCALGHEVHLWHYAYPAQRQAIDRHLETDPSSWTEIEAMCASTTVTVLPTVPSLRDRAWNRLANVASGAWVSNPQFRGLGGRTLHGLVERIKPDLIWAQHLGSAQMAVLRSRPPVIYSHTDWLFRVKALAAGTPENPRLREAEHRVARQANCVVSGSAVEAEELRALGCRNVFYIPVAFRAVTFDQHGAPCQPPRVIHLGGLRTTATRIGLERFLSGVWTGELAREAELVVVGDQDGASERLRHLLAGVSSAGYVADLGTVLRPFDVHVIPWEFSTGQRTRLIQAFNYGQAVVSTRRAVACFPEARSDENCLLVESIADMGPALRRLLNDAHLRQRLGLAARRTFERCFTRAALLERYRAVLAACDS